jgi:hypothetical protein
MAAVISSETLVGHHNPEDRYLNSVVPEDGGSMSLRNIMITYQTARYHKPEDWYLKLYPVIPEDKASIFLRNVDDRLPDSTVP